MKEVSPELAIKLKGKLEELNFSKEDQDIIFKFLLENPDVLQIWRENNYLISLEEAIAIAYRDRQEYEYLKEFDCRGYFSSFKEDTNFFKEIILWVLAGYTIKVILNKNKQVVATTTKEPRKTRRPKF